MRARCEKVLSTMNNTFGMHIDDVQDIVRLVALAQAACSCISALTAAANSSLNTLGPWVSGSLSPLICNSYVQCLLCPGSKEFVQASVISY